MTITVQGTAPALLESRVVKDPRVESTPLNSAPPQALPPEGNASRDDSVRSKLLDKLSQGLESRRTELRIEQDAGTGKFVHKVIDLDTGKLLRQFPGDSALAFAREIADELNANPAGNFLDARS